MDETLLEIADDFRSHEARDVLLVLSARRERQIGKVGGIIVILAVCVLVPTSVWWTVQVPRAPEGLGLLWGAFAGILWLASTMLVLLLLLAPRGEEPQSVQGLFDQMVAARRAEARMWNHPLGIAAFVSSIGVGTAVVWWAHMALWPLALQGAEEPRLLWPWMLVTVAVALLVTLTIPGVALQRHARLKVVARELERLEALQVDKVHR